MLDCRELKSPGPIEDHWATENTNDYIPCSCDSATTDYPSYTQAAHAMILAQGPSDVNTTNNKLCNRAMIMVRILIKQYYSQSTFPINFLFTPLCLEEHAYLGIQKLPLGVL